MGSCYSGSSSLAKSKQTKTWDNSVSDSDSSRSLTVRRNVGNDMKIKILETNVETAIVNTRNRRFKKKADENIQLCRKPNEGIKRDFERKRTDRHQNQKVDN